MTMSKFFFFSQLVDEMSEDSEPLDSPGMQQFSSSSNTNDDLLPFGKARGSQSVLTTSNWILMSLRKFWVISGLIN